MTMDIPVEIGRLSAEGKKMHDQNKLEEAIRFYESAFELARKFDVDSFEQVCAFNLAAAYLAKDECAKAEKFLQKAGTLETGDFQDQGDLHFNYGLLYEKKKDLNKSLVHFHEAYVCFGKAGNFKLQTCCLEKRLTLYEYNKNWLKCAEICQNLAELLMTKPVEKAGKLSDRALYLKMGGGKPEDIKDAAGKAAETLEKFPSDKIDSSDAQDFFDAGKALLFFIQNT